MEQERLVSPGRFCWNDGCRDDGKVEQGNIRKYGRTQKGRQRYQCRTCQATFAETKGTVFHRRHHSVDLILECLALLAERNSLAAIQRVKRVKEETVSDWLQEAARHVEEIEALLLANYRLTRVQLDALWTYVATRVKKGVSRRGQAGSFWRGTAIDMDTRLRVARAIGKDEGEVAGQLMAQLHERGHPDAPPALATDGKGSYREALVETWGQIPPYTGQRRPPTRKQPQPGWQYRQVVKHRAGNRLMGVSIQVVYGDPTRVLALLGGHTAYVERTHLASRHMNGRLVRKTLSYSKQVVLLCAASAWEDWVYNLTRPVKTLRREVNDGTRRWLPRSPAMAAGLTDHIWTVKELWSTVVVPINTK